MHVGLSAYRSVRACLVWVVIANTAFVVARRYGLELPEMGDGYLSGVAQRFMDSAYYGFMGMSFVGCFIYGLVLFAYVRMISAGGTGGAFLRGLGLLAGIPTRVPNSAANRITFFNRGLPYATGPIRDAAALFPGLGFLGTVVGISLAIGGLEDVLDGGEPVALLSGLRTAFDTTFIGLIAALVLGLLLIALDSAAAQARVHADAAAKPGPPADPDAANNA